MTRLDQYFVIINKIKTFKRVCTSFSLTSSTLTNKYAIFMREQLLAHAKKKKEKSKHSLLKFSVEITGSFPHARIKFNFFLSKSILNFRVICVVSESRFLFCYCHDNSKYHQHDLLLWYESTMEYLFSFCVSPHKDKLPTSLTA